MRRPARTDIIVVVLLLAGYALLLLPSGWDLLAGRWSAYSGGHEVLVLGVCAWLMYRDRAGWLYVPSHPAPRLGAALLLTSLLLYVFGRTQQVLRLEWLSLIAVAAALLLMLRGWRGLRANGFALAFFLFAIPLPFTLELLFTAPLKMWVSATASWLLTWAGYPAGRSGVVITIGQYQLLVAEACAGLHSMVVLEAMGLLYGHLMAYRSWGRQLAMAVLVVPLSIIANVARVLVLALLTYYFGDAVGQGFLHRFAGLLLFALTLLGLAGIDWLLRKLWRVRAGS